MDVMAGAVTFLAAATSLQGILVSGPRTLPLPAQATVDPLVIVDTAGGLPPRDEPPQTITYTLRCIAATEEGARAVYQAVVGACRTTEGFARGNLQVHPSLWLYRCDLSGPTGPRPDPVAEWPTVVATLTMKWATT